MAPASRPDGQLKINLSVLAPITDPLQIPTTKSPFGGPKPAPGVAGLSGTRVGAGSPLHDQPSRLFPKRTRELQTQNSIPPNIWGPPTSGTSTPLFEIPESPSQDGFPDLVPLADTALNSPARRGRAGTLPSRISPVGTVNGVNVLTSKTSRPTPSTSPFRPGSTSAMESAFYSTSSGTPLSGNAALLSRLRAGSVPQRAGLLGPSPSFGQNGFNSGWGPRARAATLTSISSADDPASPQQSAFSKDAMSDSGVRTLDYLGLAEPSQQAKLSDHLRLASDNPAHEPNPTLSDILASLAVRNSTRFRSFSVNTQPKYGPDGQELDNSYPFLSGGALTPSAAAALEAEYERVQENVRRHNEAVQAYAVNASAARPRARTAGLVETPQRSSLRKLMHPAADVTTTGFEAQRSGGPDEPLLSEALQNLNLHDNAHFPYEGGDDTDTQMSRSLWIGSIPNSTTMSSLDAIFSRYGPIESTRVLSHKNCGFVNYESIEHAVRARQLLNGKEIFPGAGPVRIGFAKAPNSSISDTPVHGSTPPPVSNSLAEGSSSGPADGRSPTADANKPSLAGPPAVERLADLQSDILRIVIDFGAQQADLPTVSANIDNAVRYQQLEREIPHIAEPSPNRMYDAPRLRDIRKRIDNGACALQEIEQVAIDMLPEVAELASDYLGNTVVQKLFEFCTEHTKEQMLTRIAPHLAEIGVHKNGTWAAQKIIDTCKTETQTRMIVNALRPYTVPLFLDQYGNYVLQCCLRFGAPYNDFIFETMLSQLWEIAQGRFGARAMRACLEAHHATKTQQRMLAAVIALYGVQLAQNGNGALLLTWLLDTCNFPRRRSVLAPRLVPHLIQLSSHKVAYLTVLKVINQRNEPEARDLLLRALFFSHDDSILPQILSDQTSGVTLIFKILTTPFLDEKMRPGIVQNVSEALTKINAHPSQGYKRLMDEVGLSSRQGQNVVQQFSQPHNLAMNDRGRLGYQQPQSIPPPLNGGQGVGFQRQYNGAFIPTMNSNAFEKGLSPDRTGSADSFGFASYNLNGFQTQQSYSQLPYSQIQPQSQYHNYSSATQRPHNGFVTNGYPDYTSLPPSIDPFRHVQHPSSPPVSFSTQMSPVVGSGAFPSSNYAANMYNYPQQFYFSPPVQPVHSGGRGRRR